MYQCIYADPPWPGIKAGRPFMGYKTVDGVQIWNYDTEVLTSRDLPYLTMEIDEIAALNVRSIAEKDAHLYMWVTNKHLLEAKPVIEAWGFKYSTCIVWKKAIMGGGLGGTFGINSEYLLYCRRGNLKAMRRVKGTVIEAKRPYVNGAPCHSKKPPVFRDLIESITPGRRVELFARENVPGWDAFGNEIQNSIII